MLLQSENIARANETSDIWARSRKPKLTSLVSALRCDFVKCLDVDFHDSTAIEHVHVDWSAFRIIDQDLGILVPGFLANLDRTSGISWRGQKEVPVWRQNSDYRVHFIASLRSAWRVVGGAGGQDRTDDLPLTRRLLYH